MNYQLIYTNIINKAKTSFRKKKEGIYYENHHIIPKCIDKNSREVVLLTAKEHFLVHKLLIKIYPNVANLYAAYWMMCNTRKNLKFSSKDYEEARIGHANFMNTLKNKLHNKETRIKIGLIHKNKIVSDLTRNLQSKARLGKESPNKNKIFSEEWKINLSKGKKGKSISKGAKHSQESIEANRQRALNTKRDCLCKYCNKLYKIQAFSQHHGEKCKLRGISGFDSKDSGK